MNLKRNDSVYLTNFDTKGKFIRFDTEEENALVEIYMPNKRPVHIWTDVSNLSDMNITHEQDETPRKPSIEDVLREITSAIKAGERIVIRYDSGKTHIINDRKKEGES